MILTKWFTVIVIINSSPISAKVISMLKTLSDLVANVKERGAYSPSIRIIDFEDIYWSMYNTVSIDSQYIYKNKINVIISYGSDRDENSCGKRYSFPVDNKIPEILPNATVDIMVPYSAITLYSSFIHGLISNHKNLVKTTNAGHYNNGPEEYTMIAQGIEGTTVTVSVSNSLYGALHGEDVRLRDKIYNVTRYGRFMTTDSDNKNNDSRFNRSHFAFYDMEDFKRFFILYNRELTSPSVTMYHTWCPGSIHLNNSTVNVVETYV